MRTISKLDAKTCHVLIENYLTKGNALSAYKVAPQMFIRNFIPNLKLCEKGTKKLVLVPQKKKKEKKLVLDGKSVEADNLMLRFFFFF